EEEELQMKSVQRQEEEELQMKPVQRQEEEELQMKPAILQRQEEEELQMKPVQRQEEEELQMKPVQRQEEEELQMKSVQRQEEEELQMKPVQRQEEAGGGEISAEVEQSIQSAQGAGQPLADNVRAPMENAFSADFSGVKVHTDSQSDTLNQSLQARAFTTGKDIFFRQGEYNPGSSSGKELLAHELTHTIQQGGVQRHEAQEELPASAGSSIQRHPDGEELKNKDVQVAEISEKEKAAPGKIGENGSVAPASTRTETEEKSEKEAATEAGTAFTNSQKLTPGAMSLAAAEKILQGAFGDSKKIVPGTIEILANQAACAAKYDEVCIADGILRPDGSAWQAGDCAKDDAAAGVQTEGFAWKGVVYVNGETTLVTATAHEILHNNTESNFRDKVGETFNEGVTETLAQNALKAAGITVPSVTAYPVQVSLTKLLIDLVGIDVVEKAYFDDVQELVTAYLNKGSGTWGELFNAAETLDTDGVKNAVKPKSS
ncbi:MAG: DUF4157 domain-containing protein, partial [Chloroflexi bacterium]